MTVLPDLERQLVKAAATVASAPGAPERRAPSMLVTRGRWARRRLALALSVVPVLAVVAAILSTRGADHTGTAGSSPSPALAALRNAAAAAAAGTSAPVLPSGQAWHTEVVLSISTMRAAGSAPALRLDRSTMVEDKWIGAGGIEGLQGRTGTRGADFSGVGSPVAAPGFGDWDPIIPPGGHRQVQAFPSQPAAVPPYLQGLSTGQFHYITRGAPAKDVDHSPFTQLAQLTSLLGDWPLRPPARAVAFEAIARLPGLRYLGPASDALGHRGIAVAEDGIGIPAFQFAGANPPRQDFRFTLIFDPATGRVLGARTTLRSRLPISQTKPGQLLFAWTYQPGLPQAGEVTRYTAAMQREVNRQQQLADLRKPGHPCYGAKTRLSGANANRPAAIACRNAMLRINRGSAGTRKPGDSGGRIR